MLQLPSKSMGLTSIRFLLSKVFFAVFIRFMYELPSFHFLYDEGRLDKEITWHIIGDNRAPASGFRPDASGAIGRRLNVESSNLNMITKVHKPVTGAEQWLIRKIVHDDFSR